MKSKILIVEDEFIVASDLQLTLQKAGEIVTGISTSVAQALESIAENRPDWVFLDIYLAGAQNGIELARILVSMNIPFIYVSANSSEAMLEEAKVTKPHGFIVKPFRENDILVTLSVARYRHEHSLEAHLQRETILQKSVLGVISGEGNSQEKMIRIVTLFQAHIPFDYFSVCWRNTSEHSGEGVAFLKGAGDSFDLIRFSRLAELAGKDLREFSTLKKTTAQPEDTVCFTGAGFTALCRKDPFKRLVAQTFGFGSLLLKPLEAPGMGRSQFCFYSRGPLTYTTEHIALVDRLDLLLMNMAACLPKLENGCGEAAGNEALHGSGPAGPPPIDGFIGNGPAFRQVMDRIATVAPFDISVLLLGESGTGKEIAAQSIHRRSPRKSKAMIRVNCGAIPANLIESELFGHEKGAFTGAIDRHIGKFEQAAGSTLFLDEIGELPPDLQVKLLCVLQEKEITRLGGNKVIPTDVRIIAATNRNLEKEVAEGRFRLDLYYRLNVFPLVMPPLRDRKEDIPLLVQHCLQKIAQRIDRKVSGISDVALRALVDYHWPGNIRELENIIERSILTNPGPVVQEVLLPKEEENASVPASERETRTKTIKELEREHILAVLKKCNGRIAGAGGASQLLDIPPSTLIAKMQKLGIVKDFTA